MDEKEAELKINFTYGFGVETLTVSQREASRTNHMKIMTAFPSLELQVVVSLWISSVATVTYALLGLLYAEDQLSQRFFSSQLHLRIHKWKYWVLKNVQLYDFWCPFPFIELFDTPVTKSQHTFM